MSNLIDNDVYLNRFIFHGKQEQIESLRLYLFQEIEKLKQIGKDPEIHYSPSFFDFWKKDNGNVPKTELTEEHSDGSIFWDIEFTTTHRFSKEFYNGIQKRFDLTGQITVLKVGCATGTIRNFAVDTSFNLQRIKIPTHVVEFPKLIREQAAWCKFVYEARKMAAWEDVFRKGKRKKISNVVREEMRKEGK